MKKILASLSFVLLPVFTFAATSGGFDNIDNALTTISGYISKLIPFIIGLAALIFIFGLIQFVTSGGDEEKRKEARNTIIWGIIIIFVMTSVWGLVSLLQNTFGLDSTTASQINIPGVPPIQEN